MQSAIPRERFRDLPRNPLRRRATRNRYPDEVSAVEPDDHKAIEETECKSGNDKQIQGRDLRRMVAEKRPRSLARRSAALSHIFGDSGSSDLEVRLHKPAAN